MKKKSKILITSLLAISVAGSIIAGSTYALYTSNAEETVVISTGKIKVTSTSALKYGWSEEGYENKVEVVDNAHTFSSGGTATLTDGDLVINNMIPMDGVEYTMKFENHSTVSMKYRTRVVFEGDLLEMGAIKVTLVDNENPTNVIEITGADTIVSWKEVGKDVSTLGDYTIRVEMPMENTYQSELPFKMKFTMEAMQQNVETPMQVGKGLDYDTLKEAIDASEEGATIEVVDTDELLEDGLYITKPVTIVGHENNSIEVANGSKIIATSPITVEGLNFTITDEARCYVFGLQDGSDGSIIKNNTFQGTYDHGDAHVNGAFEVSSGVDNLVLENNYATNLRQFGYFNKTSGGSIKDNTLENSKGMVIASNSNYDIVGNTFRSNATDIALIADEDTIQNYDALELSLNNNGALVDDQINGKAFVEGEEITLLKPSTTEDTTLSGSGDASNPKTYYVPAGTTTAKALRVEGTSGLVIRGEKDGESILKITGDTSGQANILLAVSDVTVKDLIIDTTASTNTGSNSIKASTFVGEENSVTNIVLESLEIRAGAGHAINLHNIGKATVNNVTLSDYNKCGIALASALDVTVSNTKFKEGSVWGDIGMMYKDDVSYEHPTNLTLGEGNVFGMGVIYSERPNAANEGNDKITGYEAYDFVYGETALGTWLCSTPVATNNGVGYLSVQQAITEANDGDVIVIEKSAINEQLIVDGKTLTIKGKDGITPTISGPTNYGDLVTISKDVTGEATDYKSLVVAKDANLTLENLAIQGNDTQFNGITNQRFVGLLVANSSLQAKDVKIHEIKELENRLGMQNGFGIYCAAKENNGYTVTLENCVVTDFQKCAILVRKNFELFTMTNCKLIGMGDTNKTAQNLLQISSSVKLTNNAFADVRYLGNTESCGILAVGLQQNGYKINDIQVIDGIENQTAIYEQLLTDGNTFDNVQSTYRNFDRTDN